MSDKNGIRVTFLDQTGAKSVEAVVSPDVSVGKIIPPIIAKLKLPPQGPDGNPLSYCLDHKEGGKRLGEQETLGGARVAAGDHLIVYPEVVAGHAPAARGEYCPAHWFPDAPPPSAPGSGPLMAPVVTESRGAGGGAPSAKALRVRWTGQ